MIKELTAEIKVAQEEGDDLAMCHVKVVIPRSLAGTLDKLLEKAKTVLQKMVADRDYVPPANVLPAVIVEGFAARYQKNPEFTRLTNWGITIDGQDGKQIKMAKGGIRVPAVFKKEILPVKFPRRVVGSIISIEFFKQRAYGKPQPKKKQNMAARIDYRSDSLRHLDSEFAREIQLKGAKMIKGTVAATDRARKGAVSLWNKRPNPVVPESLAQNLDLLNILNEREQGILKARFGLDGEKVKTLAELGEELGLTRERIRQVQNDALEQIEWHEAQVKAMIPKAPLSVDKWTEELSKDERYQEKEHLLPPKE